MAQTIYLILFLSFITHVYCTTTIGSIDLATYSLVNSPNIALYNVTYSDCICSAFFSNTSQAYQVLNYYKNNNTCVLFTNFSLQSDIRINLNSKIAYLLLSTTTTTTTTTTITTTTGICVSQYDQCGGATYYGSTTCCAGSSCVYQDMYYSQCRATTTTLSTSNVTTTTVTYSHDGITGSYWDCCKLSCAWPDKGNVTSPPHTCAQDGVTVVDKNTASSCDGGTAYTCIDQQPWVVNSTLSYGFIGAQIMGQDEKIWCCSCYSLAFTSSPLIGKQMIVQAINSAYGNIQNMFALQIPGGGWGTSSNKCAYQYGGSYSWGQSWGGISNRSDCANLPSALQSGCYWRFDWFMSANNPTVQYQNVPCPSALTAISGCTRL